MKASHPLTSEQLADIGQVVIESSCLEGLVDTLIMAGLDLSEPQYRTLIGSLTIGPKLTRLKDLTHTIFEDRDIRHAVKETISKLQELVEERNIAIHGDWRPTGPVGVIGDDWDWRLTIGKVEVASKLATLAFRDQFNART